MKFSLLKNDTTTYWDEIILIIITLASIIIGILLIVYKPSFWDIPESISVSFGVIALLVGIMYTPCIIYRLFHNDTKNSKKKD